MANSIGSFSFITLLGEVVPPVEQLDRPEVRPGVDGVGLWKTGTRGRPFRVRTVIDQPDLPAALDLLQKYRALIGADPVPLIQNNRAYDGAENFKVAVQDVTGRSRQTANSSGGLYVPPGSPGEKLVCEWTLIAVANAS